MNNLIDSLLIIDPRERIDYEEYFDHPFFKEYLNKIKINYNIYITSEIEISYGRNERIISSYEEYYKENKDLIEEIKDEEKRKKWINEENKNKNEKEIKENCIIEINNEKIPFSYFYKFKRKENKENIKLNIYLKII